MSTYVENPEKSVLCIGHLSKERTSDSTTSFEKLVKWYKERLRFLFRSLSVEGYDTYIVTSWDRFTGLATFNLKKNKPEMIADYGLAFVYIMGIFEHSRPYSTMLSRSKYIDEVLVPQEDDKFLTMDDVFDAILDDVTVVLFDNDDHDPFVQSILDKAVSMGKRMIDINSSSC